MWHIYMLILICSAAAFFIAIVEPFANGAKIGKRINWLAVGACLFVVYFLVMLARQ